MEFDVQIRGKVRKDLINKVIKFYAEQLNIDHFKYKILVVNNKQLRRGQGFNGQVWQSDYREMTIELDSYLPMIRLLTTLAHEMVHVKQMVRGQYQIIKARNGRVVTEWCGKRVKAEYLSRPWELEAFKRENILVMKLYEKVFNQKQRQ
jgi:hypothetical protein